MALIYNNARPTNHFDLFSFFYEFACVCVYALFKRIEVVLMSVAKAIFEHFNGKTKSFRNIQVNIWYEYDIKSPPHLSVFRQPKFEFMASR